MSEYTNEAAERAAMTISGENKKRRLQSEWDVAKNIKSQAPAGERKAEKDFYHGTDQQTVYNNIMEKRWEKEAENEVKKWDKFMYDKLSFIDGVIDIFKSQRTYVDNLDNVEYTYKDKYYNLKQKVEDTGQEKKIADRLSHYTELRDEEVMNVKDKLWYLYYLLYIGIWGIFIYKQQYGTHRDATWPIIFLGFMPILVKKALIFSQTNIKHISIDAKYIFYAVLAFLMVSYITYIKFPSVMEATPS